MKPILIDKELQEYLASMLRNTPQSRWFKRSDGVLFISIDDLLREFNQIKKDNLCEPHTMETLISGLEASKEIAEMEMEKYGK